MSALTATDGVRRLAVIDLAALGLLFTSALVVRLVEASLLSFPALDDPAFYLKVAENLAAGRGLVIDTIWNYQVTFPQVEHSSNEFWMPLTSLVLAPFFATFGSSYSLAQVVGAFFGALMVPVTWHVARVALSPGGAWRGLAFFIAGLVAFNPLLVYQSVTVDSATYFGLLGAVVLLLAATQLDGNPWYPGIIGVLAGLAYLARSEGVLLLGVLLAWAWACGAPAGRWRRVGGIAVGAAAVSAPWLVRNILTFGSPLPSSALALALLPDYPTLFHYEGQSYWNGLAPPDAVQLLGLRLQGLGHNLWVLTVQTLFPLTPFALFGLASLRNAPVIALGLLFGGVLFFVSALLFPVPTMFGTFYHSVGAVVPSLAVLGAVGLQRFGRFIGGRLFEGSAFMPVLLSIAAFVLVLAQFGLAAAAAAQVHQRWAGDFELASRWLKEQGAEVVMTTQPHSLHYASGLPAVMLPVSDGPEVARQVAQRYGARYVVGFGEFGRYPAALPTGQAGLEAGEEFGFHPVFQSEGVWIYEVR